MFTISVHFAGPKDIYLAAMIVSYDQKCVRFIELFIKTKVNLKKNKID